MKKLGFVALLGILLIVGYNVRPSKAEFVSPDRFLEECGYELPQPGDEVVIYFAQDGLVKLHPEVTEVVTTGYQKEPGGQIYVKVEYPFFNHFKPFLDVSCQSLKLSEDN